MIVKDKAGREIEISVGGSDHDDIEITDAVYCDDPNEEVPESVIEYITDKYADNIYTEWYENQCSAAEAYYDLLNDRWDMKKQQVTKLVKKAKSLAKKHSLKELYKILGKKLGIKKWNSIKLVMELC